ncbi:MAG: hypothetical protein SGBAC_000218 [Bacillariaceae sp.]
MDKCKVLSRKRSVDKALSFKLKADPTRLGEGESESLCKYNASILKNKLSSQLQSNKQLEGKLKASFQKIEFDDYDFSEPAPKRRRFQRRNSKTASMLSMSIQTVLRLDLEGKEKTTPSSPEYDEDIGVAEDLVLHFRDSRKRAQPMGFSLVQN